MHNGKTRPSMFDVSEGAEGGEDAGGPPSCDDGTFGGVHATSDGCDVPASGESEGFLPGFGMLTVLGTLVAAAAVVQRRIR